jgi:hypothetical protein
MIRKVFLQRPASGSQRSDPAATSTCLHVCSSACRSPYDLARNKRLWAYGAYETLQLALDHVIVDDADKAEAVATMADDAERRQAAKLLGL